MHLFCGGGWKYCELRFNNSHFVSLLWPREYCFHFQILCAVVSERSTFAPIKYNLIKYCAVLIIILNVIDTFSCLYWDSCVNSIRDIAYFIHSPCIDCLVPRLCWCKKWNLRCWLYGCPFFPSRCDQYWTRNYCEHFVQTFPHKLNGRNDRAYWKLQMKCITLRRFDDTETIESYQIIRILVLAAHILTTTNNLIGFWLCRMATIL